MFKLIEKIQKKSEKERDKIALVTSGSVTAVIALVWATVALSNPEIVRVQGKEVPVTQTATPFSAIGKDIKSSFESISDAVKDFNSAVNPPSEEISGVGTTSTTTRITDFEKPAVREVDSTPEEKENIQDDSSLEIIQVMTDDPDFIDNYTQE